MAHAPWQLRGSWYKRATVILLLPTGVIAWLGSGFDKAEWLWVALGTLAYLGVDWRHRSCRRKEAHGREYESLEKM